MVWFIALSGTKEEFTAPWDAGKLILYFWSLLADLKLEQPHATNLYEEINGALVMVNTQQLIQRTHHMDIKKVCFVRIGTTVSYHVDTIMERRTPQCYEQSSTLGI